MRKKSVERKSNESDRLNATKELYLSGDKTTALRRFDEVIEQSSEKDENRKAVARFLLEQRNYKEAIRLANEIDASDAAGAFS